MCRKTTNNPTLYIIILMMLAPLYSGAQCTASFSTGSLTFCEGETITFTDGSTPAGNLTFFYDFDDGATSTLQNPTHAYAAAGSYDVNLTIVDTITSCFDDVTLTITILAAPTPPLLFDLNGIPSTSPTWTYCKTPSDPDSVLINFVFASNIGAYTLDFGDGNSTSGAGASFNDTIVHVYQNLGTYTITLTLTGGNGCTSTITGQVINLRNPTAGIIGPPAGQNAGCAPHTIRFINNSSAGTVDPTTIFTWDMGDGVQYIWDYTRYGDTLYHTYLPGASDCGLTVTLTASNQCAQSVTTWSPVDIYDVDEAELDPPTDFMCWPNNTVTFNNQSQLNCINGARLYYFDFGDGTTAGYGPDITPYTHSYPGPGTYTAFMVDSNPCGMDTAWSTIVIANPPTAAILADPDTICVDNSSTFYNFSTGGATNYSWNFGDNTGWQNRTDTLPITHTYNVDKTYVVTMVASYPGLGCRDTTWINVVVLPGTVADFSLSDDAACDSAVVSFTDQSVNAIIYGWDLGNGTLDSTTSPPDQNYNAVGTYYVSLYTESSNGCTSTALDSILISENPTPVFSPSLDQACDSATIQFSNSSSTATQWDWDFGNGETSNLQNPNPVSFTTPGTYIVRLTVTTAAGCDSTAYDTLTIVPGSVANFTPNPQNACDSAIVIFNNSSSNVASYFWDFGNGDTSSMSNPLPVNYNVLGTYLPTLYTTSPDGCLDTLIDTIRITPTPIPDFNFTQNSTCDTATVDFTDASTYAVSWEWDFGAPGGTDTSTQQHPEFFYGLYGDYEVTLTVESAGGCTASTTDSVIIFQNVSAQFVHNTPLACDSAYVTFTDQSSAIVSIWNWDFDNNGSTDYSGENPPAELFDNIGDNPVILYVESPDGCNDQTSDTVKLRPTPSPDFDKVNVCLGDTIVFTDQTTIYNPISTVNAWDWTFGDGNTSTDTNPVNGYGSPDTFSVTLSVNTESNCPASYTDTVVTYPIPVPNFSTTPPDACNPLDVQFNDLSTLVGFSNIVQWDWDFDNDGSNDFSGQMPPQQTYTNVANTRDSIYTIRLVTTSNKSCADTFYNTVTVKPYPRVELSQDLFFGCSPLDIEFRNLTVGDDYNTMSFTWDFGDGSTSSSSGTIINHTYPKQVGSDTTYYVSLIGTTAYGCSDTDSTLVLVLGDPIADLDVFPDSGCHPLTVNFQNRSTNGSTFYWDLGDGDTSSLTTPPAHVYNNTTANDVSYTIRLVAVSGFGCISDTVDATITVHPTPVANFSSPDTVPWPPGDISYTNNTSFPGSFNFAWTYGDGNGSTDPGPIVNHTYVDFGYYDIWLYVVNPTDSTCRDSIMREVYVKPPPPQANFSADLYESCEPLIVTFTDASIYADRWILDYGDGNQSFDDDASFDVISHTYDVPGDYVASLVVEGPGGPNDTMILDSFHVYPVPIAGGECGPDTIYLPNMEIECFENSSEFVDFYDWFFGDGETSQNPDPTHLYTDSGSYEISLVVSTVHGCYDTIVTDVANVLIKGQIYNPNAFTPNFDGKNDVWNVAGLGIDVTNFELQIFNRWGELIYLQQDRDGGWDGTHRGTGEIAKQDVYVWQLRWEYIDGEGPRTKVGTVTLIR